MGTLCAWPRPPARPPGRCCKSKGQAATLWCRHRGAQAFDVTAPFAPARPDRPSSMSGSTDGPAAAPQSPDDYTADLRYGTFLGGNGDDVGNAIAVDGVGSAYVTGATYSSDFPVTTGALDPDSDIDFGDAYVAKLTPDGRGLAYATFLGGLTYDSGAAIAVSRAGSAFVTGYTTSSQDEGFPVTPGAYDTTFNGAYGYSDAFVAKLNPTGTALDYATYLGGTDLDFGTGIAVISAGDAFVTGYTFSGDFPHTAGAYNAEGDAFVARLNSAGSDLAYGVFLGGSGYDLGEAIAVDTADSAFVTGWTGSSDFPATVGDTTLGGTSDAFVARLPSGGSPASATFLGGGSDDTGNAIAVDRAGNPYVTGYTASGDFPATAGDTTLGGSSDAFVVKLVANLSSSVYATLLGGNADEGGGALAVDEAGTAYVVGWTSSSTDFPTTAGAFDAGYNGAFDAFVVRITPNGSGLAYGSYLGGSGDDQGNGYYGIAVDGAGSAYLTGATASANFPTTTGTYDRTYGGDPYDGFVVKLGLGANVACTRSGSNLVVSWTHQDTTVVRYEVYRSTTDPYFKLGDANVQKVGNVTPPAPGSRAFLPDPGVVGTTAAMYFYGVWAVGPGEVYYPVGGHVGGFIFPLVKGS